MQGKIALEEHVAIEADARRFAGVRCACVAGARPAPARRSGHTPARNGQARHRNDDPVAERAGGAGDPRRQAGDRGGHAGQRCVGRRGAQAPRSLRRLCRAADAGSGSRHRRTHPLRQGTRHGRRAGQRLFANRRRRTTSPTTICRSTGRSGARSRRSTCRSTCTRAIRCRAGRKQYDGHPWLLGPNWAFSAETAVHALRLIGSGLFDECPRLKMVLGHLGEGIPVQLWRIDNRNGWMKAPHKYAAQARASPIISASISISPRPATSTPRRWSMP